jgi:hypothetical protein
MSVTNTATDLPTRAGGNMEKLVIVVCAMLIGGCASTQERKAGFTVAMDAWIGKSADELVLAKGPPTGNFQLSTGQRILEYLEKETVIDGGSGFTASTGIVSGGGGWFFMPQYTYFPARSTTWTCKLLFTVSAKNIIESWKGEGNNCY